MINKRKKYLNNADLLREIQISKMSYCSALDPSFTMYDYIVFDETDITRELLQTAAAERMKRINNATIARVRSENDFTAKRAKEYCEEHNLLLSSVPQDEVVIRVITNEHIPVDDSGKKVRTNFESFKQYVVDSSGELCEVVRSHWKGDFEDGEFCLTHGRITNELGKMFMKLAEECSHKSNFRNYTYLDEMMGDARIQLVKNALLFNESVLYRKVKPATQLNPFAYYTSFVTNSFRSVLNTEKQVRNIRDDLLEQNGYDPSFTRQVEIEIQMIEKRKASNAKSIR